MIAWLLRANRIHGIDDKLAVGTNFVKAFHGNGFDRAIDGAQLTRWETAAQRVGYRALRRYEDLLGLPEHGLVTVADALHRAASGSPGPSHLERPADPAPQRLEQLIDRARSADPMSGLDWDELTGRLCALPSVFLYPSTLWNDLVDRLLAELIIADGDGWLQRSEALHRLTGHPVGGAVVVAACASLAADPDNQVFVDPLTQLESSPHRDAASKIVQQIVDPTNDHALRGAWVSAAEKVGRGHFTPDELNTLCRKAVELLTGDHGGPALRLTVVDLLRQTGYASSGPLVSAVRRITRADRHSRQVLLSGRSVPAEVSRAINARVGMAAMTGLPREVPGGDPMLARLLDEMLFHPDVFKRYNATLLVRATPYRIPVARGLAAELANRSILEDPAIAPVMVHTMAMLGDRETVRLLERLVLAAGVPPAIPETALWVIGHAAARCADVFWPTAIGRYREHEGNLRGIIYALGLARNMKLLRACRRDTSLPSAARRAAAWWLNIPARILDSTVKAGP